MLHSSQTYEATPARLSAFDGATALDTSGTGFVGSIDPGWTVAGKPNGGYLLAMLGRAAARVTDHPHVIAASAHYLRPPDVGEVTITAEVLRSGRSASHVRARMSQQGRACVEALVTLGHFDNAEAPAWAEGLPDPGTAELSECVRLQPDPAVFPVPLTEQVHVLLDPATAGWVSGAPTGRGELRGWLAFPDGADFDPTSLLLALDAYPPATFDLRMTGWVPTFQLSAYVRAMPAPGPVRVLQRAQLIADQRVDEACFVWDSAGRLVAQSTQLAGIRLP